MKKHIIFFLLAVFTVQLNAQTVDQKIKHLLELDGTYNNIENLIIETINSQKLTNIGISEEYWEALTNNVTKKSLKELEEIVIPVYKQTYTETEIDDLTVFYKSEIGKLIIKNQPIILEKISLGLIQWTQNLHSNIIEEIENRGEKEATTDEIQKFEADFKDNYGLQILNLTDLALDQEHNIGNLLIDFGKTTGEEDITKIIRVKNSSNNDVVLKAPKIYTPQNEIAYDLGEQPLKVGETRDLKITLVAEHAENNRFTTSYIKFGEKDKIYFGIKYDAPTKEISYEVSNTKLTFKKFKQDFSKPYVFILKNTGKKEFHISDIKLDNDIAYLNFNKEVIKPNEIAQIRVVFSKELIAKQNTNSLILKVNLIKGKRSIYENYPDKKLELKIE